MKHNLWYRIVRWLITHSYAGMTYVIEMRNEAVEGYQHEIDVLQEDIGKLAKMLDRECKKNSEREKLNYCSNCGERIK